MSENGFNCSEAYTAALLTRMSMRPKCSLTASAIARTEVSSATFTWTAIARPPAASMSLANDVPSRMSAMATHAPSAAIARA